MGVGTYREMAQAIATGVDLFDCVIPTRLARHGAALVQGDRWNLKNAQFRKILHHWMELPATLVSTLAVLIYVICAIAEILTLLSIHNVTELIRFTQRILQY